VYFVQSALQLNPSDPHLLAELARALVATHEYQRAVKYYEVAVGKSEGQKGSALAHELASLYRELGSPDNAARVVSVMLKAAEKDTDPLYGNIEKVRAYLLLVDIRKESNNKEAELKALQEVFECQQMVLDSLRGRGGDMRKEQMNRAAEICYRLAEFHQKETDFDAAEQYFNEALKYNEGHEKALLALVRSTSLYHYCFSCCWCWWCCWCYCYVYCCVMSVVCGI